VSHTWIDDDDAEEPHKAGGSGRMWPEANLPQSSRVWEQASSSCLETIYS
jgi:hypothetical protein